MKIECLTLTGALTANTYKTPKGNEYFFQRNVPTDVPDKEDAEFFLNAGKGEYFKQVSGVKGAVKKVKEEVKELIEPAKEKKIEDYTKTDFMELNKKEQSELIKKLAGTDQRVPSKEEDRVKLLLKLAGKEEEEEELEKEEGED